MNVRWSKEPSSKGSDSAEALDELDVGSGEAAPREGQHLRALVEARHAKPRRASSAATRPVPVATSRT